MITHTNDSHHIPSQMKTKSKLQILKNCQKLKFCQKLCTRHTFWSCLIRCIHMKWIQPELKALQSGHGMRDGRTDGQTDGRTEWNQYPSPPKKKKKKKNFVGGGYNKGWIYLYIPDKFVLRKCVFQKEILIYAKCRELIERCCMKFIQTCQSFFPVFLCVFFQITFDLLLTNTSRLNTLKYTDQRIWFDFYWWSRAKQTTNSNMVWYLNMNTSTYSYWSKDVGENLQSAMHLLGVGVMGCYLWVLFLRDSMLMFIYHRHIFCT